MSITNIVTTSRASTEQQASEGRKDIFAVTLIVGLGLIGLSKIIFLGQELYWGDIELFFAPMQAFLQKSLNNGFIPLWNSHIFCGEPYVGNPQTFVLYPPAALLRQVTNSPWQFVTLDGAFHIILGGILFYPFARHEGLSRKASVFASVSFMLGGYFVSKLQFPNMTQAIAYVPAVLLAVGNLVKRPALKSAVCLGLAIGLQILSAHAQITLLTLYISLCYLIYKYRSASTRPEIARLLGWCACGIALAGLLSMGQLLPVLDSLRTIDRSTLTLSIADRFVLSPVQIANSVLPNLYGNPISGNFHAPGNYWETCCYVGLVVAVFTSIGALQWFGVAKTSVRFWTVVLLVSTWLSLGVPGGLFIDAFYGLPGLRSFHDPARFLLLASVAGAILAGLGLDRFLAVCSTRNRIWLAACAIVISALQMGFFDRTIYPTKSDSQLTMAVSGATAAQKPLGVSEGHRLGVDPDNHAVWNYFVSYADFHQNDPAYLRDLFSTHALNTDMLLGIDDAGGYDPESPKGAAGRYNIAFDSVVHKGQYRGFGADDALLAHLDVSDIYWFTLTASGESQGYYSRIERRTWHVPDTSTVSRAQVQTGQSLVVHDDTPNQISFIVPPHATAEDVIISDTYLPGWKVVIDGRNAAISRRSNGFRDVELVSSTQPQSVTMRYVPSSWRIGLYLSLLSAAFMLGFGINTVLSRR